MNSPVAVLGVTVDTTSAPAASSVAHKTTVAVRMCRNTAENSVLQSRGRMKNITGVGFICFGVNINAGCLYVKRRRGGNRYSVNLKGS